MPGLDSSSPCFFPPRSSSAGPCLRLSRPPRRPPVVDLVSMPPVAAVLHSVKLREVVQIRPSWIGRPSAVRPSSPLLSSGAVFVRLLVVRPSSPPVAASSARHRRPSTSLHLHGPFWTSLLHVLFCS
ncbi:unnamed protein product [Urochloa humidicola]